MIPARSTTVHHPSNGTAPAVANGNPSNLAGVPPGAISTSPYSAVIHHPMDAGAGNVSGGSVPYFPPGQQQAQPYAPSAIPGAPGGPSSDLLALLTRAAELVGSTPPAPAPRRRDVDQWLAALESRVSLLEAVQRGRAPAVEPAPVEAPETPEAPEARA